MKYAICILGGGPAGYTAALRAARRGVKTLLIEEEAIGGTCLHHGCIPTKTLLHSSKALSSLDQLKDLGLTIEKYSFSYKRAQARKREIIENLSQGMTRLLQERGVTLLTGRGSIIHKDQLLIQHKGRETLIETENLLLATGSRPKELSLLPFSHPKVMDSSTALQLETLPKEIIIIGGGPIGVEMATLFQDLGTKVILLELLPSLLPGEEEEASRLIREALEERGVRIFTGTEVLSKREEGDSILLNLKTPHGLEEVRGERVLVTIGRQPNLPPGVERLHLAYTEEGIRVDSRMETSIPGIYALGDLSGGYLLAHAAYLEALVAVENALGGRREIDYRYIPRCTYTRPELASVGLTEEEVKEKYPSYDVEYYPFAYNGRALVLGEGEGFIKLLLEREYREPLGLTIIGPQATEIISSGVLSLAFEITGEAMEELVFPHPTLGESLRDIFLQ